jgi:hypothetical protein
MDVTMSNFTVFSTDFSLKSLLLGSAKFYLTQNERKVPVHPGKKDGTLCCKWECPMHKKLGGMRELSHLFPTPSNPTFSACYCIFIHCAFHSNTHPTSDRSTGNLRTTYIFLKPLHFEFISAAIRKRTLGLTKYSANSNSRNHHDIKGL